MDVRGFSPRVPGWGGWRVRRHPGRPPPGRGLGRLVGCPRSSVSLTPRVLFCAPPGAVSREAVLTGGARGRSSLSPPELCLACPGKPCSWRLGFAGRHGLIVAIPAPPTTAAAPRACATGEALCLGGPVLFALSVRPGRRAAGTLFKIILLLAAFL